MSKKEIIKLIISIFLFAMGTLASLFISSYLHLLLSKGISDIGIFSLSSAIEVLILEKKARNIFIILELGVLLISVFYYFMKDNFYESKLIEITPRIKIPVPAGQMQFGSARFINDEEMKTLFTTCKINSKDNLIEDLIKFGQGEYKRIKKTSTNKKKKEKDIEPALLDEEIKQEVQTENDDKEKTYKYKIEKDIELFLENGSSLNYFKELIEDMDQIICLEKSKKCQAIKEKIHLMPDGNKKEKLTQKLQVFLKSNSQEIEEEIEKITDSDIKEKLNKMLDNLYIEFNKMQDAYIKRLNLVFQSIENIEEEADLNQYMSIAKDLEKKIKKLPDSDEKAELLNKLANLIDTIILENNKKYQEIEKMLW